MDAALEYQSVLNYTGFPNDSRNSGNISSENTYYWAEYYDYCSYLLSTIYISILTIICIPGVVGNGIVIWLLAFRVQRNPSMTYILNLAIADFGVLLSEMLLALIAHYFTDTLEASLFLLTLPLLMYSSSQFLLTAISIDRCVAVFFPLWHRCHRPPRLPAIVCALMWLLSFLLSTATYNVVLFSPNALNIEHLFQLIVNAALCLPLMTISTLALFIKVCFHQRQRRRGKLLTILLLTLAFFLLFAFPFNAISILMSYGGLHKYVFYVGILLASLNSSVNPVIYFLVGRQRKTRCRQSLKMILQRAFKEEEEEEGCPDTSPAETPL